MTSKGAYIESSDDQPPMGELAAWQVGIKGGYYVDFRSERTGLVYGSVHPRQIRKATDFIVRLNARFMRSLFDIGGQP